MEIHSVANHFMFIKHKEDKTNNMPLLVNKIRYRADGRCPGLVAVTVIV